MELLAKTFVIMFICGHDTLWQNCNYQTAEKVAVGENSVSMLNCQLVAVQAAATDAIHASEGKYIKFDCLPK